MAVTIFASNVARIRAVADATRGAGRHLVVAGRAMHRMIEVAMETGYLPASFKYHDQDRISVSRRRTRWWCCARAARASRAPRWRASPPTSIPTSALDKGDLVIFSSRTIPGNERGVGEIQNRLVDLGCELITDADALVHVTGHPRREELKEMYALVKPRIAIPMHGEARHLAEHAKLARAAGVKEVLSIRNGDMVRLAPGPAEIIDEAPVGRLFRDGSLLVPSEDGPVRERRALAFAGVVVVALAHVGPRRCRRRPRSCSTACRLADAEGEPMLDIVRTAVEGTHRQHPARPPEGRGDGARGRAPGGARRGGAGVGQAAHRQGAGDARSHVDIRPLCRGCACAARRAPGCRHGPERAWALCRARPARRHS